jgi:hypothetical protein
MKVLLVVPEDHRVQAFPGIGAWGADSRERWIVGEMLFEVGVDTLDQAVCVDGDLEDANLVAEIALEFEADGGVEVVESIKRQQLALRVVAWLPHEERAVVA